MESVGTNWSSLGAEGNVGALASAPGRGGAASGLRGELAPSAATVWPEISPKGFELWSEGALGRGGARAEERIRTLVNRARRGDDEAFETLVKHYQSRIYNHVARMVQDPSEAEDLAQETFVRAYQALPRFRGEASFQTWLYRIASNLAIDASRRRKRRQWQTVSLDEPIDDDETPLARDLADSSSRTPGEAVASGALRDQVWSAISELSEKLRPVVILYDLQGLSYEEIASILGCPLGTVKSRLFNARCQLRDKLRARLPEDFLADLTAPKQSAVLGAAAC